ncbi:MAG: hypothetical protein MUP13_12155, partial [Thermoanaerobaculales bacterium]|nr:hypothetical protein [Thermoanaerobaculales bacterium]
FGVGGRNQVAVNLSARRSAASGVRVMTSAASYSGLSETASKTANNAAPTKKKWTNGDFTILPMVKKMLDINVPAHIPSDGTKFL